MHCFRLLDGLQSVTQPKPTNYTLKPIETWLKCKCKSCTQQNITVNLMKEKRVDEFKLIGEYAHGTNTNQSVPHGIGKA